MKIYVAASNQEKARFVAEALKQQGQEITSSWVYMPFHRTEEHTPAERREIATRDVNEVKQSDFFVLVAQEDRPPGGKFVEAGVAIGCGIPVVVIGRRENMLMWHPYVLTVESLEELIDRWFPEK